MVFQLLAHFNLFLKHINAVFTIKYFLPRVARCDEYRGQACSNFYLFREIILSLIKKDSLKMLTHLSRLNQPGKCNTPHLSGLLKAQAANIKRPAALLNTFRKKSGMGNDLFWRKFIDSSPGLYKIP